MCKKYCEFNDCGWCYAPDDVENNKKGDSGCYTPQECTYNISLNEEEEMHKEFKVEAGNYVELSEISRGQHEQFYRMAERSGGIGADSESLNTKSNWSLLGVDAVDDIMYYDSKDEYSFDGYDITPKDVTEEFLEWYNQEDNPPEWYDYDNQYSISLAPVGLECEFETTFFTHEPSNKGRCKVIAYHNDKVWIDKEFSEYVIDLCVIKFRPLDYDKNKQKVVDLDWLVASGIDCEFRDDNSDWFVDSLKRIDDDSRPFFSEKCELWKQCRPRTNHKMVLTMEQYKLIPLGFGFNVIAPDATSDTMIIEFLGLQDGWEYPWGDE